MSVYRNLLIDAIIGRGFKSSDEGERMRDLGLANFTGNQWNESWAWDRGSLELQSDDQLVRLYKEDPLPMPTVRIDDAYWERVKADAKELCIKAGDDPNANGPWDEEWSHSGYAMHIYLQDRILAMLSDAGLSS